MSADTQRAPLAPSAVPVRSSRWQLGLGVLGRAWLWFVIGTLLVTFVPILFGWRPYVVESGSMEPRIDVGDVVLAAPVSTPQDLVGRVTVFTDPDYPTRIKTHRVVSLDVNGDLVTKGDANPTNDPQPVPMRDVRGLGRLLVSFAGLPLVWLRTGQWILLALFLASVLLAGYAVSRDSDDDEDEADDDGPAPPDARVIDLPSREGRPTGLSVAASGPMPPGLMRWAGRAGVAAVMAGTLAVPTAGAAFSATTRNANNSWSVANVSYASAVTALSPWLYWPLDDTGTGTTVADASGNGRTGQYNANGSTTYVTKGVPGALTSETTNLAVTLVNAASCINTASTTSTNAPTQLTEIVWFRTSTVAGGKLLGFEQPRTGVGVAGSGGTYDRHLYMDGAGKVWFGVYNGGYFTISSGAALNDGAWHMAAATLGSGGMALYIDGVVQGTSPNTVGEATTGWFRSGCGNLAGWGGSWTGANSPGTSATVTANRPFAGSLDEISVWNSVLTVAQLNQLYFAH